MGFEWAYLRNGSVARDGPELYGGRLSPPWPPSDVRAATFTCCGECVTRATACNPDCPRIQWKTVNVVYVDRPRPERRSLHPRSRLLRRIRKVKP
jgi:hypothetical protein